MARVTVEDCLAHVENRFELVLKASERAHHIELGAVDPMVPKENDKPTVIALREIAAGYDVTSTAGANEDSLDDTANETLAITEEVSRPAVEDDSIQ